MENKMASIYVQVGNDVIEFPEGTTDEQIEKLLAPQAQVTPPSSGFMMGLKDPITGGAQMLPRALAGVTSGFGAFENPVSKFFSSEAKRMDELARAEELAYQQQRQARGETGFDVPRLAGNVLNPATIVPAVRAAQVVRGVGKTAQTVAGGVAVFKIFATESSEYARAQAEAVAQQVNVQNALKKANEEATEAMNKFKDGTITASQALAATAAQGQQIQILQAKNVAADSAAAQQNALQQWWNGTNQEEEKAKRDKTLTESRQEFIKTNQPALNALARQSAAGGGNFQTFLDSIERENKALYDSLIAEGTGDLEKAYQNITKEVEIAAKAIEAMNIGFKGINGVAGALSVGLSNQLARQEAGYSLLGNSIALLEASVTDAAVGISDADFESALQVAESGLRQLGADPADIQKFRENLEAINIAQKTFATATEEAKREFSDALQRGAGGPGATKETVAKAVGEQLDLRGVAPEVRDRIVAAIEGGELGPEDLAEIAKGNIAPLSKLIEGLGEKTLAQIQSLAAIEEFNKVLTNITKQRLELENEVIKSQRGVLQAQLEAQEIIAKYGGPQVTPAMRRQNILDQANIQSSGTGVSLLQSGSADELNTRSQEARARLAEIALLRIQSETDGPNRNIARERLSGEEGAKIAAEEKRLQELAKSDYETTKQLIKLKEEELKLIQEKNRLEKSSIEALITGDIAKFFEQQAAVGATAAIALGSSSLQSAFGPQALGQAALDIQRQQEAGVQSLYGQQLSGAGGLTERGFGAAISARGVGSAGALSMSQIAAGTTSEEESARAEIRSLAETLPNYAQTQLQVANQDKINADVQYRAAQMQLEAAKRNAKDSGVDIAGMANGGIVYANRGIFVPRGTDTVPAMLTPGEFVVRREAVQRGNNLQVLQSMNRGQSGVSNNGAVAMADGGVVYARRGIFFNRNSRAPQSNQNSGVPQSNQTGMGLSPDLINKLATSLQDFNTKLESNIQKLNNTTLNIKLDTTNVNVNLNGGTFLAKMKDDLKSELLLEIGGQISNASIGQDGKIRLKPGVVE